MPTTAAVATPSGEDQQTPRVWCLLGRKAGDNTQVRVLADALGWPWEEKHIRARPWELLTHLALGVTLAGIDRAASSALAAPWPDLVLTAGRRNEPVARWIARASGGRTRLVHIGRPWAPLASYDLVVTTPQYHLPQAANILHNHLPLCHLDAHALADAAAALAPRIAQLPRPHIAVLLGGDSGKFVFTADKGRRLGRLANQLAESVQGSTLVVDSPRTPAAASDACRAQLAQPHFSYRWKSGDGSSYENPYTGVLACADAFIVTGESMSMLAEARSRGRPLYIFDLDDAQRPWWRLPHAWRYKPLSHRLAMRFGPARMRRDIGRIQATLVAEPGVRWLDESAVVAAAVGEHMAGEHTVGEHMAGEHTAGERTAGESTLGESTFGESTAGDGTLAAPTPATDTGVESAETELMCTARAVRKLFPEGA